jgi:transcriptional regulator with XRE-family HTH domain
METEEQEQAPAADRDGGDPDLVGGRSGDAEISGLIRRVRRLMKVSQRELAQVLGVSQSAVAKWETGRTCPSARMLVRILEVAELGLAAVTTDGERVSPMKGVAARDAGGRRYPAHTFVWAEGWWAPEGAGTTAWYTAIVRRRWLMWMIIRRGVSWWPRPGRGGGRLFGIWCRSRSGRSRTPGSHATAGSTSSAPSPAR